jgi:hypothetical protein
LRRSVGQHVLAWAGKRLRRCRLNKGIAARDQIPHGLASKSCGPECPSAYTDVQSGIGPAGRSVSNVTADRLGAGRCGANGVSKIVAVRHPISNQRVSLEVQHFTTPIADLICAPSVGEAQQSRNFFQSPLPAPSKLFDQGRISGHVNK